MPELRSGARRSHRLGDLQPASQPANQEENFLAPAQNRTRRRGRGRGNAAGVAKGPSAATPARPTAAGRGRGVRLIDLDPNPPREILPQAGVGAGDPACNKIEGVANKEIPMEGGSADKVMGVEEEPSSTPVPDRVIPCPFFSFLHFLWEYCGSFNLLRLQAPFTLHLNHFRICILFSG